MTMHRLTFLLSALAGVGLLAACQGPPRPPPAIVVQQPAVMVPGPPPPMQAELVPTPPAGVAGIVWQPGHWQWTGQSPQPWQWVTGRYEQAPAGLRMWVPGRWEQAPVGGWSWIEGHWAV